MFIQWVQSDLMSMKAAVNPERWGNWQYAEARMGLKLSDQPVITLSLETSKWMQELASKQGGEKGLWVSVAHLPQRSWYPQEGRNVPTKQTEVESQLFSPKTRGLDKVTPIFTLETGHVLNIEPKKQVVFSCSHLPSLGYKPSWISQWQNKFSWRKTECWTHSCPSLENTRCCMQNLGSHF